MKPSLTRKVLLAALGVVLVLLVWQAVRSPAGDTASSGGTAAPTATATTPTRGPTATTSTRPRPAPPTSGPSVPATTTPAERTDPVSGLPWIDESRLTAQGKDTLARIRAGGPFAFPEHDGKNFGNFERLLPRKKGGYYREYTVARPDARNRGPVRIIAGASGEYYWTTDHYESFRRIREGS